MKIFRWIKIIVLLYCIVGIAAFYLQDRFLFHPETKARNSAYNFEAPHKEVNIAFDAGSNLHIVQFTAVGGTDTAGRPKGLVLYFHGNKKNISWYSKYATAFTQRGYECWMIDYPGFGKSTGVLTEERLYGYAAQLYKLGRTRFASDSIIIYGKSMGTGIAAQLAAVRDARALVLETPYYSIHSLVSRYLPVYPVSRMIHYRLPTFEYLPKVTAPIIIFHGTNDNVVPYSQADRLRPLLKPGDKLVTIEGGEHNNLTEYKEYTLAMDSLLK
jgi:pimeloyl-ACP methyl ester carboxylesterase